MRDTILKYKFLWVILLLWILSGILFQPLAYVVVLISLILFIYKNRMMELFIGFLFILMLSDHVSKVGADPTMFAKNLKGLYLLFILFFIYKKRSEFDFYNPIFKSLLPFFVLAIIALVYSIDLSTGVQKTTSYILLYALIPVSFIEIYKIKGVEFLKLIAAYFFLVLLLGLLLQFILPDITQLLGERYRGLFGNPNGLGLILVQITLFISIIRSFNLVDFSKREWNLFYLLIIFSLLLSGSRNGMFSIILFLFLHRVFKIHFLAGVLVLFTSFYIFQNMTIDLPALVQSLGLEEYFRVDTIESGSGRFIAWDFAWQKIQNYYFIGGGFGQDEQVMRPNYHILSMLGHQGGVHNSYLSMWLDTGLIGLILYFSGMITLIWRASKNSPLAWPFFFTILFNITYESWLVGSLNPFTIIFLCSLTLLVMKKSFVSEDVLVLREDSNE